MADLRHSMDEPKFLLESDSECARGSQKPARWQKFVRPLQGAVLMLFLCYFWTKFLHVDVAVAELPKDTTSMDLDLLDMREPKYHWECESFAASKAHRFSYNVTNEDAIAEQWRLLDNSAPKVREQFRGEITIDRGSPTQDSDIDVVVIVRSTEKTDLDNVLFKRSDSALEMDYNTTETKDKDLCTDIQIIVYIRPWPSRLLELLEIRTDILDIFFKPGLNWEVNNLVAHTSYGETMMQSLHQTEALRAHNISISSIDGGIVGDFVNIENTELRTEGGIVFSRIIPNLWSGKPYDPKSFSISTISGSILAVATLQMWPAIPLTTRTKIETVSGHIRAQVAHGSYTNFSTTSGTLRCYIRPYGAATPHTLNEIYTKSQGHTKVWLDTTWDADGGEYDPLLSAVSEHEVGEGKLELRYGIGWWGEMEATIDNGPLKFKGTALDDVRRGDGYVKARRGPKGNSRMNAHVGSGKLDIRLGMDVEDESRQSSRE